MTLRSERALLAPLDLRATTKPRSFKQRWGLVLPALIATIALLPSFGAQAQTQTTTTLRVPASPVSASSSLLLEASVAPGAAGTVSFTANGQVLGTAAVEIVNTPGNCDPLPSQTTSTGTPLARAAAAAAPNCGNYGWATVTLAAGTLAAGQHTITAGFISTDPNYTRSTSSGVSLTVTAAGSSTLPPLPQSPAPIVNYEYDAEGNPTKTVVAPSVPGLGLPTTHAYDPLGRRKTTVDAKNGLTQFGHDGQDRLTQVTDPRSLVTQYQLNGLGDQSALVSPDTGTATSTYDAAGNVKTSTDARGFISSYSYDALNRLTKISIKSPIDASQREITYTHDLNDARHGYGIGRLTRTRTPEATTDYLYDAQGRILNVGTWFNADSTYYTAHFAYDAAGKITSLTYPSGRVVEYPRSNGQITSLTLQANAGGAKQTLLSQIQTSPFGPIRSWSWQQVGGPKPHERIFDANGRLVRYPLGTVVRDLSYDAADRITAYTHYTVATGAAQPALNQSFGYDELGRLKTASHGSQSWAYDYDATGNRTLASTAGSTRHYTIAGTSNRVTAISNPARSLGYDAAGNTLSDSNAGSGYTAVYNHEGRLAQLTSAGGTVMKLSYNAQGQRVKKQIGSNPAIYYAYDLQGQLLGEYTLVGTQYKPLIEYIWLEGQPVAVVRPTPGAPATAGNIAQEVFYIHTDHLGAPRLATDQAGMTRWRWFGGEPFGVNPAEANPNGLGELNITLRLPGQQFDGFVGLHYNYFRDYDPTMGRYVQSDPIGLAGGINTYAYVDGNPLSYYDPYGLFGMDDVWGGVYWATGGWSPSQGTVDFSAGLGDALLLGTGGYLRDAAGVDGGVDQCSDAYRYGSYAALAAGGGRMAYAGLAKAGSVLAASGAEASAFRAGLKTFFRGGIGRNWRPPNLAGKTDAQLRASAGKTNLGMNAYGAGVGAAGGMGAAQCGCPK